MLKIDKLLESGCSSTKKDKVCRTRGGESCAFDGAMIVLQPIKDTLHIVHGPVGCLSNYFNSRGSLSDDTNRINFAGIGTCMNELDIIYGAENKLIDLILESNKKYNPKAIFVYLTCISGLIGEDIERICKKVRELINIPVIPVDSPGFVGPKNLGNRIAGEVLLKYVIGTKEPPYKTQYDINIIGEYNIAGDLFLVEPILKEAGIRVLSRITGNSTYDEICWANHAKLNVVICGRALINIAKEMEKKYGIPYIETSFFGVSEFSKSLRLIAYKLDGINGGELRRKIEPIILREEKRLKEILKNYSNLKGKRVFLYTGGVKSWSFISALKDLGMEIAGVGTKKSTYEDEEKILELVGDKSILLEDVKPKNILKLVKEKNVDLLVAGGRNMYLAVKENIPFIDVNQERHRAYAGYEGLVNLASDISESLSFYKKRKKLVKKEIITSDNGTINPVKNSPLTGALIASQGLKNAIPIIHGTQGCNFLSKVLLTKHFREPIVTQTTGIFTESVILGADNLISSKIEEIINKQKPSIIAILKSGLVDVKGEDLTNLLEEEKAKFRDSLIFLVDFFDYEGGMETGYVEFLKSLISSLEFKKSKRCYNKETLNIISGPHLGPGDHLELHKICSDFGFKANILPDLSLLTGIINKYPSLTYGGTELRKLQNLNHSIANIVIGDTCKPVGNLLLEKTRKETYFFKSLSGIKEIDNFLKLLSKLSNRKIPEHYKKERKILEDTIKDAHFYVRGKKFCTALQVSESILISEVLKDMDIIIDLAITPEKLESINKIRAKRIIVGDLNSIDNRFDIIISNSHAKDTSKKLNIPLYQFGFPLYGIFGGNNLLNIGYKGSSRIVQNIVNTLLEE